MALTPLTPAHKEGAVRRPSLAAAIAAEIRSGIVWGTFAPGARLTEHALAARFGVSRTPLREAVGTLVREGFIARIPSVGLFVQPVTRREIEELYPILFRLEQLGVESARRPSRGELDRLELLNRSLDESHLIEDEHDRAYLRLKANNDWHLGVAALAGNRELDRLLEEIVARASRYIVMHWLIRPQLEVNTDEHRRVMDALARGDTASASEALASHNRAALSRLVEALGDTFEEDPRAPRSERGEP